MCIFHAIPYPTPIINGIRSNKKSNHPRPDEGMKSNV